MNPHSVAQGELDGLDTKAILKRVLGIGSSHREAVGFHFKNVDALPQDLIHSPQLRGLTFETFDLGQLLRVNKGQGTRIELGTASPPA